MNKLHNIYFLFTLIVLNCITASPSNAQTLYGEDSSTDIVKTIQLVANGDPESLPVIDIENPLPLAVSFDHLDKTVRNFYYRIIHCNRDWTPSKVKEFDYAMNYNEGQITDYTLSQNTQIPYIHYQFAFPNEQIAPKIAGNYLLEVYEDADPKKVVWSERFYVVRHLFQLSLGLDRTLGGSEDFHRLSIEATSDLTVARPEQDLQIIAMQNRRPDKLRVSTHRPQFTNGRRFQYNRVDEFRFPAGNEFNFFDIRSLQTAGTNIAQLTRTPRPSAAVNTDRDQSHQPYVTAFDHNGAFFVDNIDWEGESSYQADYVEVKFSLEFPRNIDGKIYLVGAFNKFERTKSNELAFDDQNQVWCTTQQLKQGLYDYTYVLEDKSGHIDTVFASGNHFETGNEYQVFVYHRRSGTYWDELLGYATIKVNRSN